MKEWDQKRAVKLILHRRLADEIDFSLQNRLSESDNFLRVVLQFLSDSEEQKVEPNRLRKNIKTIQLQVQSKN